MMMKKFKQATTFGRIFQAGSTTIGSVRIKVTTNKISEKKSTSIGKYFTRPQLSLSRSQKKNLLSIKFLKT